MGCFDELVLPWRRAENLAPDDADVGEHLAENFRELDRWANPLVNHCGGGAALSYAIGTDFAFGSGGDSFQLFKFSTWVDGGIGNSGGLAVPPSNGLYLVTVMYDPIIDPGDLGTAGTVVRTNAVATTLAQPASSNLANTLSGALAINAGDAIDFGIFGTGSGPSVSSATMTVVLLATF